MRAARRRPAKLEVPVHLAIRNPWHGGGFLIVCANIARDRLVDTSRVRYSTATVNLAEVTCKKCRHPLTGIKAEEVR